MPDEKTSVTSRIYAKIKEGIIQRRYFPGEHLVEEDLSAEYGCSRATLRGVLRRLSDEGLTEYIPNRGVRVKKLNTKELVDIQVTLQELESLAARLAARNRTADDLQTLREMTAALTVAVKQRDPETLPRLSVGFQLCVAESSGNFHLMKLIHQHYDMLLCNSSSITYTWQILESSNPQSMVQYQLDLIAALESQDADRAAHLVKCQKDEALRTTLKNPDLIP